MLVTQRYLELEAWDEGTIQERAAKLIDTIIEIWPGPDGTFTTAAAH